jgi:hypothetical protein
VQSRHFERNPPKNLPANFERHCYETQGLYSTELSKWPESRQSRKLEKTSATKDVAPKLFIFLRQQHNHQSHRSQKDDYEWERYFDPPEKTSKAKCF